MSTQKRALGDSTNSPVKASATKRVKKEAPTAVDTPDSRTRGALRKVSRAQALATLDRLAAGYKDKSGQGYAAARRDAKGCLLAQKKTNRVDNGYIQIAPLTIVNIETVIVINDSDDDEPLVQSTSYSLAPRSRGQNGQTKGKTVAQNAHRLVVIAHKE
jgi:hypothetical protein